MRTWLVLFLIFSTLSTWAVPQGAEVYLTALNSLKPEQVSAAATALGSFPDVDVAQALMGRLLKEVHNPVLPNTYIVKACLQSLSRVGHLQNLESLKSAETAFIQYPKNIGGYNYILAEFQKTRQSLEQIKPKAPQAIAPQTLQAVSTEHTDKELSTDRAEFEEHLLENRKRVDEFNKIAIAGKELGLHVWIWGGIAAGYGDYDRRAYLKEKGVSKYQKSQFTYVMSDIFSKDADVDLVVDGTGEQCELLKKKLMSTVGHNFVWDIRPLRQNMIVPGAPMPKEALLNNPGFMDQNNDSASLGFIELTEPNINEPSVRDLRSWDSDNCDFFNDLFDGKIRYYFSDRHGDTPRARNGDNPQILSVIRILIKSAQLDRQISNEDMQALRKVIAQTDINQLKDFPRRWIERKAKKLLLTAMDLNQSVQKLDSLGLRELLKKVSPEIAKPGTLGWWMNREPLSRFEVGSGNGQTAAELGLTDVAHETRSVEDFWNMVRNPEGKINAFISRPGIKGEGAYFGPGFYICAGNRGAYKNGIAVQLKLDPKARLGTDFVIDDGPENMRILNGNAVTWDPAKQTLTASQYFRLQFNLDTEESLDVDPHLRPIIKILVDKMKSYTPSTEEMQEIGELLDEHLKKERSLSTNPQDQLKIKVEKLGRLLNTVGREEITLRILLESDFLLRHPEYLTDLRLLQKLALRLKGEQGAKIFVAALEKNLGLSSQTTQDSWATENFLQQEILSGRWTSENLVQQELLNLANVDSRLWSHQFLIQLIKSSQGPVGENLIRRRLESLSSTSHDQSGDLLPGNLKNLLEVLKEKPQFFSPNEAAILQRRAREIYPHFYDGFSATIPTTNFGRPAFNFSNQFSRPAASVVVKSCRDLFW